jgi:hypothetical protein
MIGKCPHCGFIGELFTGGGATHLWCADWKACDYRYGIRRRHEFPLLNRWDWHFPDDPLPCFLALPF